MSKSLHGKTIAILATDGYEQSELQKPLDALRERGARVDVIAPDAKSIKGWKGGNWGESVDVDVQLADAKPASYDALVLPGGVINPDKLRLDAAAIEFIAGFKGKPLAAICHGPWTLIDAGIAKGKRLTSWPSLRVDLENAGARWEDSEVVVDGTLVTSRKPADLPAFIDAISAQLER